MTAAAAAWQRVYNTRQRPEQTPNARACERRRNALRAAGLCIFCGQHPATSLCRECQGRQGEQRREHYRAALARVGCTVRPYRRKAVRP
jgi:hypothetical protein